MPQFKILSADHSYRSAQIDAADSPGVLDIISQLDFDDADVLQDNRYLFSARLCSSGAWVIFQRNHRATAAIEPAKVRL